jgi:hypothetical protein
MLNVSDFYLDNGRGIWKQWPPKVGKTKSSTNRLMFMKLPILVFASVLSFAASELRAQIITGFENYSYLSALIGQGSAQGGLAFANNSCVPTSTANGLSFLEQYAVQVLGIPDPFTTSPNTIAAVNALQTAQSVTARGTSAANALAGLNAYLSPTGSNPAPSVVTSQTFNPSADSLGNALNANNAIQLGVLWGNIAGGTFTAIQGGGGHFVSLTAMYLTNGVGFMTILDPWGSLGATNADTEAAYVTLAVQTVNLASVGNVLQVTWTTNAPQDNFNTDGTDPSDFGGFGGAGATGYIAVDNIEMVPEPTAVALLTGGGLTLFWIRRRHRG